MDSMESSSTSSTYRTVTVDGSATAHLGNTHHDGTIITVQQYVFVFGHHPSSCAPAPTPSTSSPTKPLYSHPRSRRTTLRPSPRAPLPVTSRVQKRQLPASQHPGAIPSARAVTEHHTYSPTRAQLRQYRRRPPPKYFVDNRARRDSHSAELG